MIKNPFQQLMKKEKTSEETDPNKGLIDEIRILSKRIKKLETEVEMLKNLIQQEHLNETSVSEEQQENPTKQDVEDTPKRMEQTTIYLSAPTPEGVFNDFAEEIQIGKSIYVLITDNNKSGSFSVIESKDAIATAIISTTQFLKPACKIVSSTNGIPNHIVTLEKGIATFDGEKWKVEQKAVIRLDSRPLKISLFSDIQ